MIMQICRLEFTLHSIDKYELAPFLGSTIRGAFGNILKDTFCIESHSHCPRCLQKNRCSYTFLFESGWYFATGDKPQSGAPQPYVFEPQFSNSNAAAEIKLGLLLFGNAIDYWPVFIYCIEKAGQRGLGKNRGSYTLQQARDVIGDRTLWSLGQDKYSDRPLTKSWDDYLKLGAELGDIRRCQIEMVTPLRMKRDGHLHNQMDFSTLIKGIMRRWALLNKYYGDGSKDDYTELINLASSVPSGTLNLHWQEMERYSRRQDQRMMLGGLRGTMECEGNLSPFLPWLLVGEDIHVGKNTTFGLGKYVLKCESDKGIKNVVDHQ
jgi:hypothetical protein